MERLVNIVEFILRGIGGGLLGGILGLALYGAGATAIWPPWAVTVLDTVADSPTEILFVDVKIFSATEAESNTLYLQTAQSGVYVLERDVPAYPLEALPNGEKVLELRLLDNKMNAPLVARSDQGRD